MEIASLPPHPRRPTTAAALAMLGVTLLASGTVGLGCRRRDKDSPAPAAQGTAGPTATPAPTGAIQGRVVDRRGNPVPEARVLAFGAPVDSGPVVLGPVETATDLDGKFRLAGLALGPSRLLVEASGFPALERRDVSAAVDGTDAGTAGEVLVQLQGEGAAVVGRVEAGGEPIAGARVLLAPDASPGSGGPVREATSHPGGGFAFGGLGPGAYALRAFGTNDGRSLASELVRGVGATDARAAKRVVLQLGPAAIVAGRIVDDSGAALAGVEARAESAAMPVGDDPVPVTATADSAGRFQLGPLPPGSYRVSAARPGYVLRRTPVAEWSLSAPMPPPVVLELVRGARLLGRVLDPGGGAAAGARVVCVASALTDLTVQVGPLPLAAEAAALPSGAGRALGTTRAAIADRAGRFAVDDLVPGRYRIEIARAGAEPFRSDELALAPGERRDLGTLSLRPGVPFEGRVVDEGGIAIEGARVTVEGANGSAPGVFAVSDGGGRFAFALPVGRYQLTASAPGRGAARRSVEIAGGAAPAPLELRLVRAEASLEGLVRDTGGRPLARARVLAWPAEAAAPGAATATAPLATASTDVGGHFTLRDLPAGDLRLEVQHPDYPTTVQSAGGGQFAQVTVPFPGGISGEVRARVTGAAIPRAHVAAAGPDGAKASADSTKDGAFRLLHLAPGHWHLTVGARGAPAVEREIEVPPAATLGEASVRDVRIELDAG